MAYPLFQIVDAADDSTVLFDMHDPTGAANPNSIKTYLLTDDFDAGSDDLEEGIFDFEDRDGGEVVYARRRLTEMSWRIRAEATTYANLVAGMGTAGKYLERGGVIKYQATASDAISWADFVPAPAPVLYRGQARALFKVVTLLKDPDGVLFVVRRQPGWRRAAVTFGPTVIPNDPADTNGRVMTFTVPGDLPALGSLKIQADTGSKVKRFLIARRSQGQYPSTRVSDWASTTMKVQLSPTGTTAGWLVAHSNGTAAVTPDADASGNNAAEITFTNAEMLKRIRVSRTANMDSLRGDHDVYVRFKAGAGKYTPQLRWAPSLADPCTNVEPEAVPLDGTGLGTLPYNDWYMGRISIPQAHMIGGVALEVWARRDSGAGTLRPDVMMFVPAGASDAQSVIEAPAGAMEVWTGSQLLQPSEPAGLGAGVVDGTSLRFNNTNEAGGTPPNTGLLWPAGRHVFTVTGGNNVRTSASLIFRVRNITDDTYAVTKTLVPQYSFRHSIEFDVGVGTHAATDTYQVQVVDNSPGFDQPPKSLDIWTIEHSMTTYLLANEELHAEVNKGLLHKMDASDNIVSNIELRNGPFPVTAPPGLTGYYFHYGDVPSESDAPGPESKLTRDCTVTFSLAPRYKNP